MTLKEKPKPEPEYIQSSDSSPAPPEVDESNWLVSYADMMTLLCGFFIMLLSMAKMDEPKYDGFKQEMVKQFGGKYTPTNSDLEKFAADVVEKMGVSSNTVVKADAYGISIAFESAIFFETSSSDVTKDGDKILGQLIDAVSERQKKESKIYRIVVEGHTDSRSITSEKFPSNWELSGARASRVVRMFIDRGFASNRLTSIGYADTHPKIPSRTPAGQWDEKALGKNRRVIIRVLNPGSDVIPLPDSEVVLNYAKEPSQASPIPAPLAGSTPVATAAPSPITAAPSPITGVPSPTTSSVPFPFHPF